MQKYINLLTMNIIDVLQISFIVYRHNLFYAYTINNLTLF